MPHFASLARASALALALLVSAAASAAPADDTPPLMVSVEDGLVSWTSSVAYGQVALEVAGPSGIVARRSLGADELPSLDLLALGLPDGEYSYRAVVSGLKGEHETLVQTGMLVWADGVGSAPEAMAQVFTTDVIVQGSLCTGLDCVNGESFGFDTLRLKENNLRIHFQDTSTSASFPTRDWRIRINDTANGGDNFFAVEDSDLGTVPFRIESGAGNNALHVDASGGNVGMGTGTPVVELHISDGDSPTVRLEQSGASGFTPQTWDMAGNESNFFIRDVTNGSNLPFRIQPSAPDDALFIASDGDIGLGTNAPTVKLQVGTTSVPGDAYITGALTIDGEVEVVNKSIDVDKDVTAGRDIIGKRNLELTDNYDEVTGVPFFILDRNNSSNQADDVMLLRLDGSGNLAINGMLTENGVPFNAEGTRDQLRDLEAENEELRARIERLERLVEELATRDQ